MESPETNPYRAPPDLPQAKLLAAGPHLASRLTRLGAALLDGVIAMAVVLPLTFLTGYWERAMEQEVSQVEVLLHSLAGMVIYLALHGYLLATKGQSVGKMIVGIRIVSYRTGEILPFGKLVGLRLLPIWIISLLPFGGLVALIDILFIFGDEQRCVHDLMADSKVVVA